MKIISFILFLFLSKSIADIALQDYIGKEMDIIVDIMRYLRVPTKFEPVRRRGTGIIFVKTHKTASSTVTSILNRYCIEKKLNCYLHTEFNGVMRTGTIEDQQQIKSSRGLFNGSWPFDCWDQHVDVSRFLFSTVPSASRQLFTIVRDPAARFISAFYFFGTGERLMQNLSETIEEVHRLGQAYHSTDLTSLDGMAKLFMPIQKKKSNIDPTRRDFMANVIYKILSGEWLSLVTERFDESLVAYLHFGYGMNLSSLVYRSMKVHEENTKTTPYVATEEEMMILRANQPYDYILYIVSNLVLSLHKNDEIDTNALILADLNRQLVDLCSEDQVREIIKSKSVSLASRQADENKWLQILLSFISNNKMKNKLKEYAINMSQKLMKDVSDKRLLPTAMLKRKKQKHGRYNELCKFTGYDNKFFMRLVSQNELPVFEDTCEHLDCDYDGAQVELQGSVEANR